MKDPNVQIKHILPEYPEKVHVQWTVESDDSVTGTYNVQRSGSPEGPWKTIEEDATPPAHTDDLRDEQEDNINQLSVMREIWYRIELVTDEGRAFYSDPVDNENNTPFDVENKAAVGMVPSQERIDPNAETTFDDRDTSNKRVRKYHIHRKYLRDYIVGLRVAHGTEIAILKRKHFGKRCDKCFDQTTKEVLVANCDGCYGTGWEGGYFDSIFTLGKVTERGARETTNAAGESATSRAKIEIVNFPRVEAGDVIVKTDENDRFVVKQVRDKKLRQRTVKQTLTCEKVGRTSSMYDIPVTETTRGLFT